VANYRDPHRVADHEAGHAVSVVHNEKHAKLVEARIDHPTPRAEGLVQVQRPPVVTAGMLLTCLIGPLCDPTRTYEWPPPWPSCLGETREGLATRLALLEMTPDLWARVCDLAVEMASDPEFRLHVALVSQALFDSTHGRLTGTEVEQVLGR
jgi:hypothetical protein